MRGGREIEVAGSSAWVRGAPAADAGYESQLVCGERFRAIADDGKWAEGECAHDGFRGFVELKDFRSIVGEPSHGIATRVAPVLPEPRLQSHPTTYLSVGSAVRITDVHGQFLRWEERGWLNRAHLARWPPPAVELRVAISRLQGVPFVWGGRSGFGVDCSGFIQLALGCAGLSVPRDLDEQVATSGSREKGIEECRACDLVLVRRNGRFTHGGFLIDRETIVHTGRRFAAVGAEPLTRFLRTHEVDRRMRPEQAVDVTFFRPPPIGVIRLPAPS